MIRFRFGFISYLYISHHSTYHKMSFQLCPLDQGVFVFVLTCSYRKVGVITWSALLHWKRTTAFFVVVGWHSFLNLLQLWGTVLCIEQRAPKTSTLEEQHLHVCSGEDLSLIASAEMKRGRKNKWRKSVESHLRLLPWWIPFPVSSDEKWSWGKLTPDTVTLN